MGLNISVVQGKQDSATAEVPFFAPARILEIELEQPVEAITAYDAQGEQAYQRALAVVRLHGHWLGVVELELDAQEISAQRVAELIWRRLHYSINAHLRHDGLPTLERLDITGVSLRETIPPCARERECFLQRAPFVSIVIPTHDRPAILRACLDSLLRLEYPDYEIIVVDNAPSTTLTADLLRHDYRTVSNLRYVREDRPGPSPARNAGMLAAQGEIIAFADDDVVVDRHWLSELARGFERGERVACVTGLLLPRELETPAQYWCEENRGAFWFVGKHGWDRWPNRRLYDGTTRHLHLYRIGLLGCGASMAFRADILRQIGGFDPALGGRGPSRCGQDIAALFQVVMQGQTLVYEPEAVVYHLHRRDYGSLRRQFRNYGVGLSAYLIKNVLAYPQLLGDLLWKVPRDLLKERSTRYKEKSVSYPKELTGVQWNGVFYGPLAYLQSCWIEREARRELSALKKYRTRM